MSGVKDVVFGSSKSPRVDYYNPFTGGQQDLLGSLVDILNKQMGQGVETYPGEMVPGASDIQNQVFGIAGDALGKIGQGEYGGDTRAVIERLLSGTPGMTATTPGAVGTSRNQNAVPYDAGEDMQYWTQAFLDPAMQAWNERVAPQVREKFIAQNIGSSSGANNALSRSAGDMMTNLTGQLAGIMQGNKQAANQQAFTGEENFLNRLLSSGESEAGRQMTAQGLNAQLGENVQNRLLSIPGFEMNLKQTEDPTQQLLNLLGIGTEQRNIAGQQDTAGYQKWMQGQPYSNPWLKLLGMSGGTSQVATGGTLPGSQTSGLLQDVLAPLLGGAMAGGVVDPSSWFKSITPMSLINPMLNFPMTGNIGQNASYGTYGR